MLPMFCAFCASTFLSSVVLSFHNIVSYKLVLLFFGVLLALSLMFFDLTDFAKTTGFYLFMVSELFVFFAAFWALFHKWGEGVEVAPTTIPSLPFLGSLLLALSCWFSTEFLQESLGGRALDLTIGCGSGFLAVSLMEFCSVMVSREKGVSVNSVYFLMLLHCFHVFLGLLLLLMTKVNLDLDRSNQNNFPKMAVLYWHFVDLMWLFVLFAGWRFLFHAV